MCVCVCIHVYGKLGQFRNKKRVRKDFISEIAVEISFEEQLGVEEAKK